MREEPKRLMPTVETARELYLKSGNECAFPGCNERIINADGTFIGEICHIEAALPGGERFNQRQSNEERRSFGNLMLMCHAHHKITDDVNSFSVERMKQMKAEHEAKFTNIVEAIRQSIVDYTAVIDVPLPSRLENINRVNEWDLTPEQLAQTVPDFAQFLDRIKPLPEGTRELLTIMVLRGEEDRFGHVSALLPDIAQATRLSRKELYEHVQILERYKVAMYDEDNVRVFLGKMPISGASIWSDLKVFCNRIDVPLREILVSLRFDLLD